MGGARSLPANPPRARRPRQVYPARWSTLRQCRYPSRYGNEQDSQRLHREVAFDDGLRRALRPGLRAPRAAERATRRARATEERQEEERPQYREFSPRLSRARAERVEEPNARLQRARHSRRVGRSLSHDVERLRSGDGAHVRALRRAWLRLQRRAPGLL